ncbi:hypothetical protein EG68_01164 [Paragonimus skrjabini miyazakii]|uniref:Uncharacterized protein n=1 Tax=Paragonimus skrjabini miyazakii TaxID=59628 RepID=A0A8S9ZBM9_9TREM|nr:hypothetical protein EG68_01164 [Paragonimus skrjabini miyazakii]
MRPMDSHDVIVSSRLGMFFNAESREKTFRLSLCSVGVNLLIFLLNVSSNGSSVLASSLVEVCRIILTLEKLDTVWTSANKWIDNFQFLQKFLSLMLTFPVENDQLLPLFNPIYELLASQCVLLQKSFAAHLHSNHPPCFSAVELVSLCQLLTVWSQISSKLQEISNKSATPTHSCIVSQQNSNGSQSARGSTSGLPFSTVDYNTIFHAQPTDVTLPETMELNSDTSWSVCPSVVDLLPTRPRGVLKNQLGTQCTQDATDDTHLTKRSNINLVQEFLHPRTFKSTFNQAFVSGLELAVASVQIGTSPVQLDLTNPIAIGVTNVPGSGDAIGSRLSLLLQIPVFSTSGHGPLFGFPGSTIVEKATEELTSSTWGQQFHSSFTVQSAMSSWVGAVGTGAGLPFPVIRVSESVSRTVSLIVSAVLPTLLSLIETDLHFNPDIYVSPNLHETADSSPDTTHQKCKGRVQLAKETATGSNHEPDETSHTFSTESRDFDDVDSFRSLVISVLNILLRFLDCKPLGKPDSGGVADQIFRVVLDAEEDLSGMERIALCISDCLLLRSLCHLIASVFRNQFKISTSLVAEPLDFPGNDDLSTQMMEATKQYDSSIRVLSEHLVDLSLMRGEQLVIQSVLHEPGLTLLTGAGLINVSSSSFVGLYHHLAELWQLVSHTCPAGLARQIMAHVSAQGLLSALQLSCTKTFLDNAKSESDLRLLLRTAEFCLFTSSETTAEVVGLGQLPGDISLLHSVAISLSQMLVCRHMPPHIWNKLHLDGFYKSVLAGEKPFEYALSNWLPFTDPVLFPNPPFLLLRDLREQTELELEWELFASGHHFDPIRLLNLVTLSEAKLSVNILSNIKLSDFTNTDNELLMATNVFTSLFRICSLLPGLESFHSNVLIAVCSNSELRLQPWTIETDSSDLSVRNNWPVWLRAIFRLLSEPLEKLWDTFEDLVQRHINTDESLSKESVSCELHQSPKIYFVNHKPRPRTVWNQLFPSGLLPCGCEPPIPARLGPWKTPASEMTIEAEGSSGKPRSKRQQATRAKYQQEQLTGSYVSYYAHSGYIQHAWSELACDLVRSVVVAFPTGIQLALSQLEELLVGLSSDLSNTTAYKLRGGSLGTHIILASLKCRILDEFEDIPDSASNERQIARFQHLVLWEHLCSILEDEEEDEELTGCKRRVASFLDSLRNCLTKYPGEQTDHSTNGRRFQLAQHVRRVQTKALPDLYFLHKFFKRNLTWIRGLIRAQRGHHLPSTVMSHTEPILENVDEIKEFETAFPALDAIAFEELDWERLSLVNIGLNQEIIEQFRSEACRQSRLTPQASFQDEA